MELFTAQMPEIELKFLLKKVLENKKPFERFKHPIETSSFREAWFEFQQNELEKIVAKKLEHGIKIKLNRI